MKIDHSCEPTLGPQLLLTADDCRQALPPLPEGLTLPARVRLDVSYPRIGGVTVKRWFLQAWGTDGKKGDVELIALTDEFHGDESLELLTAFLAHNAYQEWDAPCLIYRRTGHP